MMQYSEKVKGLVNFGLQELNDLYGDVISQNGLRQLRIAETEKYAHVTFFFDGGVDKQIEGADRILVESPKVATFDLKPEMSAYEVTEKVVEAINKDIYVSIKTDNNNYKSGVNYNNEAYIWWDATYKNDIVPYFPDSEFLTSIKKYDYIFKNEANNQISGINNSLSYHAWSKYGNHAPLHISHSNINHIVDPMTDNIAPVVVPNNLWKLKKNEGINICIDNYITADAPSNTFTLNQSIINNKNLIDETNISSEINKKIITYSAAVNEHILTLDSNHAALVPTAPYFDKFELWSGNTYKTILKGNRDFIDYKLDPITQNSYNITHTNYLNDFEVLQNGFPQNNFKIINGINEVFEPKKDAIQVGIWNPFSLPLTSMNEFVILNGGIYKDAESSNAECLESQTNNFVFSNGSNSDANNILNPPVTNNNILFNNGDNVHTGDNVMLFTNGSEEKYSDKNIIRFENIASDSNFDETPLLNTITLDNDKQSQNIVLSKSVTGSSSTGKVGIFSDSEIGINSTKKTLINSISIELHSDF
jgi:hypothetical protein